MAGMMESPLEQPGAMRAPGLLLDENGLILPRKLENPCLCSTERKSLHRELMFNQRVGRNVLSQKSELQRAWDRMHTQEQLRSREKDAEDEPDTRTEFQRRLAERAAKIEQAAAAESATSEESSSLPATAPEFLQVHARVKLRGAP